MKPHTSERKQKKVRDSGIESLKIIAIFIIMISHVTQTLTVVTPDFSYFEAVADVSIATTDVQTIVLLIFRHFGILGNNLFFICSAWFLLKSTAYNKRKWFFMLAEIWSISVIILSITYFLRHGNIPTDLLIKCVFPTLYANNWYMTCYLIFYMIHPVLNGVIQRMSRVSLFRTTSVLVIIYLFLDFVNADWFFPSQLTLWLTIYFAVAYMKNYLMHFADNIKANVILVIFNAVCFIGLIILTEIGGLHVAALNDRMMRWANYCNPFMFFISVGMFNIARNIHFKNMLINYISSLTLLIYIIHENLILRTYYRPAMWDYIYHTYGFDAVVGWIFIMVGIIFLFSVAASAIYTATIKKIVVPVSDSLYEYLRKYYLLLERKLLKNN